MYFDNAKVDVLERIRSLCDIFIAGGLLCLRLNKAESCRAMQKGGRASWFNYR